MLHINGRVFRVFRVVGGGCGPGNEKRARLGAFFVFFVF